VHHQDPEQPVFFSAPAADANMCDRITFHPSCRSGRITKIQGFLSVGNSSLLVTYGNLVQRYGDWQDVKSTTPSVSISAAITRVGVTWVVS
jgi:hypothetical protein